MGGGGFGQAGLMGGMPAGETVINNYYDEPRPEGQNAGQLASTSDDQDYDNGAQTQDADYDDSNDDSFTSDDSSDIA